ncbi:hypothetical protein DFJ73DRAFT_75708 [Zopfochytrium polystomum]|nr:hypothetical protein DFJ73DRAFT_75708 [Zopfochytrium polystomum]
MLVRTSKGAAGLPLAYAKAPTSAPHGVAPSASSSSSSSSSSSPSLVVPDAATGGVAAAAAAAAAGGGLNALSAAAVSGGRGRPRNPNSSSSGRRGQVRPNAAGITAVDGVGAWPLDEDPHGGNPSLLPFPPATAPVEPTILGGNDRLGSSALDLSSSSAAVSLPISILTDGQLPADITIDDEHFATSSSSPPVSSFALRRSLDIALPRLVEPSFTYVPFPTQAGPSDPGASSLLSESVAPSASSGTIAPPAMSYASPVARKLSVGKSRAPSLELDAAAASLQPRLNVVSEAEEDAHALACLEGESDVVIQAYLTTLKLDRESEEFRLSKRLRAISFGHQSSFSAVGLCSMRLKYISPNVGLLYSTVVLQLCCNELTTIPPEIGYMQNLQILSLENNKLVSLPASIGLLSKLTELNVSRNSLTAIPDSVGMLTKLTTLSLERNGVTALPISIGRMSALTTLNVSFNPVSVFPGEISRLKFLRRIYMEDCPLDLTEPVPTQTPSSLVPSLKELVARAIIRQQIPILASTENHLKSYLASARPCSFCGGPYFDLVVIRRRIMEKGDDLVPLEYRMCSVHWTTEEERIQAMFAQKPPTAMPSNLPSSTTSKVRLRLSQTSLFSASTSHGTSRAPRQLPPPPPVQPAALSPSLAESPKSTVRKSLKALWRRSTSHLELLRGTTPPASPSNRVSLRRPLSGIFGSGATTFPRNQITTEGEDGVDEVTAVFTPVSALMPSPSLPELPATSPKGLRSAVMRLNRMRTAKSVSSFGPFG